MRHLFEEIRYIYIYMFTDMGTVDFRKDSQLFMYLYSNVHNITIICILYIYVIGIYYVRMFINFILFDLKYLFIY